MRGNPGRRRPFLLGGGAGVSLHSGRSRRRQDQPAIGKGCAVALLISLALWAILGWLLWWATEWLP